MAGILANSASRQMSAGETLTNGSVPGFVVGERITLSVSPAESTSTAWAIGRPGSSAVARSALSADAGGFASFTPDVGGFFVVTATVDGAISYTLVVSVTDIVISTLAEALRIQAMPAATIPAPTAQAVAVFAAMDTGALAQKSAGDQVTPLRPGLVGALLTDGNETLTVADGVHRTLPTLTGARTKTLGTSGAALGHVIEIHRVGLPATNTSAVVNGGPGAGTLFTFPAGELYTASFRFDGTNWALSERRKLI